MIEEKTLEEKRIEYHLKQLESYISDCNASAAIDRGYLLGILHIYIHPKYKEKFDGLVNRFRKECDCKRIKR